eukprot:GEZU01027690.1.p1 GENE.GEZU01027690.1~~GEZU01027690.1.p1  ORF type:complete len:113 (+),score=3.97 GEZU01027690.1:446-784(+)
MLIISPMKKLRLEPISTNYTYNNATERSPLGIEGKVGCRYASAVQQLSADKIFVIWLRSIITTNVRRQVKARDARKIAVGLDPDLDISDSEWDFTCRRPNLVGRNSYHKRST